MLAERSKVKRSKFDQIMQLDQLLVSVLTTCVRQAAGIPVPGTGPVGLRWSVCPLSEPHLGPWSGSRAGTADSPGAPRTARSRRRTGCPWRRARTRPVPGSDRPASTRRPWWTGTGRWAEEREPGPGPTAPWSRWFCWGLPCFSVGPAVPRRSTDPDRDQSRSDRLLCVLWSVWTKEQRTDCFSHL